MKPDIEAIRARCDAATKGPWRVDGNTYDEDCNEHLAPYGLEGPNERMIWSSGGGEYSHPDMATAQFIAHSRTDIPALLAYVEELERERDEAQAQAERLRGALPPRSPDGRGLTRYGLHWNGPCEPVAVPLTDGYWTPWHLASAAYRRGAEAMREACQQWCRARENDGNAIADALVDLRVEDKP